VVIAQAPVIYTGVLTLEQLMHGNSLRLHHLFAVMDTQWREMGGGTKNDSNDDGEIALISFQVQGVCFICNKKGHRAHECPNKKANGNGNGYNGKGNRATTCGNGPNCGHCGKPNHVEKQCWRKPGNEYLKLDWLKKKEQASALVDEGTSPELLLCCMEVGTELSELQLCGLTFPMAQKILIDPNVWIAD
jgi:hypothetical protein